MPVKRLSGATGIFGGRLADKLQAMSAVGFAATELLAPVTWDDALKAATALTKAPEYYGWILKLAKDDYGGSRCRNRPCARQASGLESRLVTIYLDWAALVRLSDVAGALALLVTEMIIEMLFSVPASDFSPRLGSGMRMCRA
jgi:hypothetical protein